MRKTSHMESSEPILEHLLSEIRQRKALKYIKNNSKIADLGCGYRGNLLKRLSKKIDTGYGFDVSVTDKKIAKNIVLKETDLNKKITDKYNFFDAVTALAVLEHVQNPKIFIKKISKILKKDGLVILTTPHRYGKLILEALSVIGLISKDEIDDHKNYFDSKALEKLVSKEGFEIVKCGTFGIFWLNVFCVAKKN